MCVMKKSIAYIRCSTADQLLDSQRVVLEKYFKDNNIDVEFYEEFGSGGSVKNRPVFNKLMDEVRAGLIDRIYVYRLDRFSRNTRDFLNAYEEMEKAGTHFISISDHLDFSTPVGRMMAQMLSVLAEFQRRLIIENTKDGLRAARARGVRLGAKPLDIDMARVPDLIDEGFSVSEIAKKLGISKTALYDRLKVG